MHPRDRTASHLSLWLYRRIIMLYPPAFRRRFEAEMMQVYQDMMLSNGADLTILRALSIWAELLPDLCSSIFVERLEDWRNTMKTSWLAAKMAAGLFLAVWIVFVIASFGESIFKWQIKNPTNWLLGDQFSSLAYLGFSFALVAGPFIVMLVYLLPHLQVKHSVGDELLVQVGVRRISRGNALVIAISVMISLLILAIFTATRIFGL
jgi:hypothetical protein